VGGKERKIGKGAQVERKLERDENQSKYKIKGQI
jgi:hypothetical protein